MIPGARFLVVLLFLLYPLSALAGEKILIVEKEGEAVLGEDTTPTQAKAQALNNARRAAIEEVSGAQVAGSTVVYNLQVVSDFVSSAARGVIVREELLSDEIEKQGKFMVCKVRIRAHVKPQERRDSDAIIISGESIGRYGAAPAGNGVVFQDNDEISVRARLQRGAFVHLFSIDKDGMVTKLYPNEYCSWEPVAAGSEFVFPDERLREMGLKLRVRGAKNLSRTPETMLILATKEKVQLLAGKTEDAVTVTDLMKEVSALSSPWAEKVLGYEVRK